jgi:hypothetical protein
MISSRILLSAVGSIGVFEFGIVVSWGVFFTDSDTWIFIVLLVRVTQESVRVTGPRVKSPAFFGVNRSVSRVSDASAPLSNID